VNDPAIPPIGERLREARAKRGLSVRGLARVVAVSPSLISQIETGKSSPSVSTLYAITNALQISIEDVFGEPAIPSAGRVDTAAAARTAGALVAAGGPVAADAGPDVAAVPGPGPGGLPFAPGGTSAARHGLRMLASQRRVGPVVRQSEREVLHLDSGVTWELLGQLSHTHMDFLRITYAPGGSSSEAGVLMRRSGTEYGHVLSGRLTLTLGFETYELGPGDSVSFDCSTPHAYANHGTEPAVGVWWVFERFG
jgi:transcriptional regulator with XRE-family HTH domain/quercetin dioxygenase-like cupin family protein